jgi:hypothetical protein
LRSTPPTGRGIFSRLLQFAGVALMMGALVLLARWLAGGRAAGWVPVLSQNWIERG